MKHHPTSHHLLFLFCTRPTIDPSTISNVSILTLLGLQLTPGVANFTASKHFELWDPFGESMDSAEN